MSGSQIGGVIGAVVGAVVTGNPIGAIQGYAIGAGVGGIVLPEKLPTNYGPRLEDLHVQTSVYGNPIPIVYGTAALQGTVIWAMDIKEVSTETEQGGKGGPSQTSVNYTYFGSFAVAICEGPITGVSRIWAGPDKRLIYDGVNLEGGTIRVYLGDEDQLPDPLIESAKGVGLAPAYRGTAYVVFEDFPLAKDGNRLPFLTFEIGGTNENSCPVPASTVNVGGYTYHIYDPAPVKIADADSGISQYGRVFSDALTGWIYYTYKDGAGVWCLNRVNPDTGASGPVIGLGTGTWKMAWNNQGLAQIINYGSTGIVTVNLIDWVYSIDQPLLGIVCVDGEAHCAAVSVPVADVWWNDVEGMFQYLSWSNNVNGYVDGIPAIEDVDTVVRRTGNPQLTFKWGATGERFGGDLMPMWGADAAAASFSTQPSNYAPVPGIYWDAYDSKRRIIVDFTAGVYNDMGAYVDTAGFAIPDLSEGQAVYSPNQDMFYVVDNMSIRAYDPDKLSPSGWEPEDCVLFNGAVLQAYANGEPIPVNNSMRLFLQPTKPDWLGVITGGGDIMEIFIGKQVKTTRNGAVLGDIVRDLSIRAGLTSDQVNVDALTDIVDGYVISRQTEVRAAIDVIRPAYYFDAVESQGVIKFVKRGSSDVTVIPDNDLGASEPGNDPPDPLQTVRRMESELPRAISVKYLSAATDYDEATRQARRLIVMSEDEKTIEVPLVMTDTKAQEVAEVNLHATWGERLAYQFSLPRKYSYLEPTDLVVIKGHLMRLTTVNATPQGVLRCEALADEIAYYAPHVVVTEPDESSKTVFLPGVTLLELF